MSLQCSLVLGPFLSFFPPPFGALILYLTFLSPRSVSFNPRVITYWMFIL